MTNDSIKEFFRGESICGKLFIGIVLLVITAYLPQQIKSSSYKNLYQLKDKFNTIHSQEPRNLCIKPSNNCAISSNSGVAKQDDQLKLLYDYTIFHIGVYITLITGILGVLKYKTNKWSDVYYFPTLIWFTLAGLCGGIVCSNIPNYVSYSSGRVVVEVRASNGTSKTIEDVQPFLTDNYAIFESKKFSTSFLGWIMWEHLYFWLGVFWIIAVLLIQATIEASITEGTEKKLVNVEIKGATGSIKID